MNNRFLQLSVLLWMLVLSHDSLCAEAHRATHLGNPATRFAPPLTTPAELRSRFQDERLRADIAEVLRQWGWTGRLEDLFQAARTGEVREVTIAVGTVMPFMSSRENGKAICLRNVTWAGREPAPAYLFNFSSNGRNYRCITPKACSNFYVEDLGPKPVPMLAVACIVPPRALPGRAVEVCLVIRNPGTGVLKSGEARLVLAGSGQVLGAAQGGVTSSNQITWAFTNLAPNAELKLCGSVASSVPGQIDFRGVVESAQVATATSDCRTTVIGIPAILIDAVDLEDPVEVGHEVTYDIAVTNQGSSEATNVKLAFLLPSNEQLVSGSGPTPVQKTDAGVATDPLPVLAPKGVAVWRVVVKAVEKGDVRFQMELTSDQFVKPIHEEESTLLY